MSELFPGQNPDDNGPQTAGSPPANQMIGTSIIKPTPHLPVTAAPYKNPRDPLKRVADPIGLAGLPDTRYGLECKLLELCNRLASAGGQILSAKRLVTEMELTDDRTLRLLAAYGHVQHRIRQLVGIEGVGYCWGDSNEGGQVTAGAVSSPVGADELSRARLSGHGVFLESRPFSGALLNDLPKHSHHVACDLLAYHSSHDVRPPHLVDDSPRAGLHYLLHYLWAQKDAAVGENVERA